MILAPSGPEKNLMILLPLMPHGAQCIVYRHSPLPRTLRHLSRQMLLPLVHGPARYLVLQILLSVNDRHARILEEESRDLVIRRNGGIECDAHRFGVSIAAAYAFVGRRRLAMLALARDQVEVGEFATRVSHGSVQHAWNLHPFFVQVPLRKSDLYHSLDYSPEVMDGVVASSTSFLVWRDVVAQTRLLTYTTSPSPSPSPWPLMPPRRRGIPTLLSFFLS